MIRYKLNTPDGEVVVSLDSEQPNKVAPLQYQGESRSVMTVKRWLHYQVGAFGHQVEDWTTPLDLETVMGRPAAQQFSPQLVEKQMGGQAKSAGAESEG